MTRISRAEALTLGGILLLAVLARYTGLAQGFPRDFHWDERIYFHEALYGLANGLRRESTVSANLPYLLMPVLLLQWLYGALTGAVHSFADLTRAYIADPRAVLAAGARGLGRQRGRGRRHGLARRPARVRADGRPARRVLPGRRVPPGGAEPLHQE